MAEQIRPQDMSSYPRSFPDLEVTEVHEGDVHGFHLVPRAGRRRGVAVTVGGSEGSCDYGSALELARLGVEVFAVFYWGQQDQQRSLAQVPLERWQGVLEVVHAQAVDISCTTALGTSKGAEYLLAANSFPSSTDGARQVDHLVLTAPSAWCWPGLAEGPEHSSWTLDGVELPYLGFRSFTPRLLAAMATMALDQLRHRPLHLVGLYRQALRQARPARREQARIPAERFTGDLVLFAGADDQMWPSADFARTIRGARPQTVVHELDGAGHMPGAPVAASGFLLGGTELANERAERERRTRMRELVDAWHPLAD